MTARRPLPSVPKASTPAIPDASGLLADAMKPLRIKKPSPRGEGASPADTGGSPAREPPSPARAAEPDPAPSTLKPSPVASRVHDWLQHLPVSPEGYSPHDVRRSSETAPPHLRATRSAPPVPIPVKKPSTIFSSARPRANEVYNHLDRFFNEDELDQPAPAPNDMDGSEYVRATYRQPNHARRRQSIRYVVQERHRAEDHDEATTTLRKGNGVIRARLPPHSRPNRPPQTNSAGGCYQLTAGVY